MKKINTFRAKGVAMLMVMAMVFSLAPTMNVFADDDDHYEYDKSKKVTVNGDDFYYVQVKDEDIGNSGVEISFGTDFTPTENHVMAKQIGSSNLYYANPDAKNPETNYYGCADIKYPDYWKNEGLSAPSAANFTATSSKKDSEGFNDMGGFDTVSRSTSKHGTYRGAFQFVMDVYGYTKDDKSDMKKFVTEHDPYIDGSSRVPPTTPRAITSVPTDQVASCADGAKTFTVNGVTYNYDHYVIKGIQRVPVKINGALYVSNLILKNENLSTISNFDDFRLGGQDGSNRVVDQTTGGMKELMANGEYGPITAGVQTMNKQKVAEDKAATSINYNHKFGEYAEVQVGLKNADGSEFSTSDLLHYLTKFTSATYIYYKDDSTYTTPVATYGSMGTTDTWWSTNHGSRIDAGFMFDSYRLGSPDGQTKNKQFGNWRVIFRSAGYEDLIADFDLQPEISYDKAQMKMESQIEDFSVKNNGTKKAEYSSSNEDVVKIDKNGIATAVGTGSSIITATVNKGTAGDLEETATTTAIVDTLTVMSKNEVALYDLEGFKEITLTAEAIEVSSGLLDPTITWASSDPEVATVDSNGKVTAGTKKGTAKITATANGFPAVATVTYGDPSVKLDKTSATIYTVSGNNSTTLNATVDTPTMSAVEWTSSNTQVATVDNNGKIQASTSGTAEIIASADGYSDKAIITVKDAKTELNEKSATLYTVDGHDTFRFVATVDGPDTRNIAWASSDENIASVVNGTVTAKKSGTVKISATANGVKAEATVTVKNATLSLNRTSATIYSSGGTKTVQLSAKVDGPNKTVTWSSSDKNVARVDSKGLVTAVKAGKVKITAKANGIEKVATITVDGPKPAAVVKAAPKSFKAKSQKKKAKLTWKKSNDVTKYQVGYKLKGKKWKYKTVSSSKKSLTIKKLKSKKKYQFKIRSYKTTNGKKVYSKWSKTKTIKIK